MNPQYLGRRLAFYRTRAKLRQKDLANILHVANSTISQYESGERTPSDELKIKICQYFKISLNDLVGFDTDDASISIDPGAQYVPLVSLGGYFSVRVLDDAMDPLIPKGSVVLVENQEPVNNHELAVVQMQEGDALSVRRIEFVEDGIMLLSENEETFPAVFIPAEKEKELSRKLYGAVVEVRTPFLHKKRYR